MSEQPQVSQAQASPSPSESLETIISKIYEPDGDDSQAVADDATSQTTTEQESKSPAPERLSRGYAEIAKRERAVRELQKQVEENKASLDEYNALKSTKDPREILKRLGLSPMAIAEAMMGQEPEEPPAPHPEVVELRKMVDELREQQKQAHVQRIHAEELAKIKGVLSGGADKYEVLHSLNNSDEIANVILQAGIQWYQEHGEAPDYGNIAEMAENAYFNEYKTNVEKLLKIGKLKSSLSALLSGDAIEAEKKDLQKTLSVVQTENRPISKTLSDRAVDSPKRGTRPMNDEEREAEALALFKKAFSAE